MSRKEFLKQNAHLESSVVIFKLVEALNPFIKEIKILDDMELIG